MTLSTSLVLSTDSKSGFRTPAVPTSASTAVPPRAGFGTVATGWQPTRTTTAASAAVTSRLSEITGSQRGEEDRAHEEGDGQDPGRPGDLALQPAAGGGPRTPPLAPPTHRPAGASRPRGRVHARRPWPVRPRRRPRATR